MSNTLSIQDLPIEGKRVLVRVDFNVPLDSEGIISDDTRIRESLPTIQYILQKRGIPILMSHLGRPNGKPNSRYSLKPCAERLGQLLKKKIILASDCIGQQAQAIASRLEEGEILLLENLRFHPAEESPEQDPSFVQKLAQLGEFYINDAFGTAHRKHSSTALIAERFKGKSAPGFLMEKEIRFLNTLNSPQRPFYALIGGAKISGKIGILKALCSKVDGLLIGGAMAFTFFKALGYKIGSSLCEDSCLDMALEILETAKSARAPIILPIDAVASEKIEKGSPMKIFTLSDGIPENYQGADIGPKTVELFLSHLCKARTIFWNGPVGVFEIDQFAQGTCEIAKGIAEIHATSIIGGGDSVAAIHKVGLGDKMTHLSTGGGAALEYIEKGNLPGIEALNGKIDSKQ